MAQYLVKNKLGKNIPLICNICRNDNFSERFEAVPETINGDLKFIELYIYECSKCNNIFKFITKGREVSSQISQMASHLR